MAISSRPPGPSLRTEWRRPVNDLLNENSRGLLVSVRSLFGRFGDLYFLESWKTPTFVTRHPDHVHEVLVTRASSFVKRAKDLETFLGRGLLTSDGAHWRKQRRLIQPAFSKANIVRASEVMTNATQAAMVPWRDGDVRDLNREMMELTLSVVCKAVLDYDSADAKDVVAKAMHVLQSTAGLDVLPKWMPNPISARKKRAVKLLDKLIFRLIDERARNPGDDLISQLLVGTDGEGMERTQLRDELVTLFLAGHETTALAMTWTFFLLAKNPEAEAKLHDELNRVLEGRTPTYEDAEALVYTKAVVQEAMRIFPPLYLLPRVAREDTEVGGYEVPKGSDVLIWVYFMHHDPRWFPDPADFRPQRFLPKGEGIGHPHAYIPFGAGPRACIGQRFALIEAQLLLAAIAQRFRMRLTPNQQVTLNPRVTLAPYRPIMMRLEARSP